MNLLIHNIIKMFIVLNISKSFIRLYIILRVSYHKMITNGNATINPLGNVGNSTNVRNLIQNIAHNHDIHVCLSKYSDMR